jgi:protein-disulfide isomerase
MAQDGTDLIPEPGADDHVRGSLDAPVVITEYGDFECPYCGEAFEVIERVLAVYGNRVALVFREFPLSMHPHAMAAAEAAEAAGHAGRFWEMHDALYRHQSALTPHDLRGYAEAIGLDGAPVETAIRTGAYRTRIERDVASGNESGIEGTPALFINGFAYDDEMTVEALGDVIDRALAAHGVKR